MRRPLQLHTTSSSSSQGQGRVTPMTDARFVITDARSKVQGGSASSGSTRDVAARGSRPTRDADGDAQAEGQLLQDQYMEKARRVAHQQQYSRRREFYSRTQRQRRFRADVLHDLHDLVCLDAKATEFFPVQIELERDAIPRLDLSIRRTDFSIHSLADAFPRYLWCLSFPF